MSEPQAYPYATTQCRFPALSLVDVPALVDACTDRWYNQTLCKVNDSVVRLGVLQGEYHWHKHDTTTSSSSCSKALPHRSRRRVDRPSNRDRDLSYRRVSRTARAPPTVPSF